MDKLFYKIKKYNYKFYNALSTKETNKYKEYLEHSAKYLKNLLNITKSSNKLSIWRQRKADFETETKGTAY